MISPCRDLVLCFGLNIRRRFRLSVAGKHCQQKIASRQCGESVAVIQEDETGKAMTDQISPCFLLLMHSLTLISNNNIINNKTFISGYFSLLHP